METGFKTFGDMVTEQQYLDRSWSSQDGIDFPNTMGVAVIDLVPHMGHMLEGFSMVASKRNIPLSYVPFYINSEHQEWFETFWINDFAESFQKGDFKVANFERHLVQNIVG